MQDKLLYFGFVKRQYLLRRDLGATLDSKELFYNPLVVALQVRISIWLYLGEAQVKVC